MNRTRHKIPQKYLREHASPSLKKRVRFPARFFITDTIGSLACIKQLVWGGESHWIREFIENTDEEGDDLVLSRWARYRLKDITDGLPIKTGNPLRDGPEVCYIPFKNGVVAISKAGVELKSYKALRRKGAIREDGVRARDINISNLPEIDLDQPIVKQVQPSPFSKFIVYAFKRGILPDATWPIQANNPLLD